VVVLDMDGVILCSNHVKGAAMLALFEREPAAVRERIDAWNRANGGVRRDDKLRHIVTRILGRPCDDATLEGYLARYAHELEGALDRATLVPGIDAFLAAGGHVFYVSSSAPEDELREQLARRGLAAHFAHAFGADTPKAEALRQVRRRHPRADIVFFGDALGDLEATRDAADARVGFVGVVCERDNFGDRPVVKLENFRSPVEIDAALRRGLAAAA
jgi:phosphoglycolate phosphatase-like HAD superfamily hydrolase